jgi:hypothetical protein
VTRIRIVLGSSVRIRVPVRRDEDPDRLGVERADSREELDARHPVHALVREHHRDGPFADHPERLLPAGRREHVELPAQPTLEHAQVLGLVVDEQHGVLAQIEQVLGCGAHEHLIECQRRWLEMT